MFTDKLMALWDTIPDTLQFNESWNNAEVRVPEYPLCATAAGKWSCRPRLHFMSLTKSSSLLQDTQLCHTAQPPASREQSSLARV